MLWDLYHSIHLSKQIPTHCVQTQSDHWLKSYLYFCTFVLQVRTLKLLATQCYKHANALRPILFNSPYHADSNETLPNTGRHLADIWRTSGCWDISFFLSADLNRRMEFSKPIPSNSSQWADSNTLCPNPVRPLVPVISLLLYFWFLALYLLMYSYWELLPL